MHLFPGSKAIFSFGALNTLRIQITTSYSAEPDWGNAMIMKMLPKVPAVVMQQAIDQILHVLFLPNCRPKVKLQASFPHFQTGNPWPPLLSLSHVFSCLKWMLTAVSTHSQTASSKSSGAFFTEMFAWTESRSLHPWGAPNVTNQMWTEKYINTMKTTWTQLVPALNKTVYPATKPIVWGLNKPAVFLFNFIVCASMCVSGFVCCMMARSDEMTFCTNSENFPQGDGNYTHTHSKRRTHKRSHKH